MGNKIQPKLSVIIPVYKAERFIERCCKSLFEQTLDNIEYIFVDDCSPDNSVAKIREIASHYPEREPMIKILTHTPNRGVSYSRQQGLDAAIGEFVIHCDSDDWVDNIAYENAYNIAVEKNADIVRFGHVVECSNGRKLNNSYEREDFFNNLNFNICPKTGSVWGGIVKRSLFLENKIEFPRNINWGEDFCVSIECLVMSKKTICLQDCFYHYWQNVDSITHTISKENFQELINICEVVESFLKEKGLFYKYEYQIKYLKFQTKAYMLMYPEIRDIKLWREIFPDCNNSYRDMDVASYVKVCASLILHNHYTLASILLKIRDCLSNFRHKI